MNIDDLINELLVRLDGGGSYIDNEMIGPVLLNLLQQLKDKEDEIEKYDD